MGVGVGVGTGHGLRLGLSSLLPSSAIDTQRLPQLETQQSNHTSAVSAVGCCNPPSMILTVVKSVRRVHCTGTLDPSPLCLHLHHASPPPQAASQVVTRGRALTLLATAT